jgi:Mg2+ and Co2+ transporter CorA
MVRHMYQKLNEELDKVDGRLRKAEFNIFKGEERRMVEILSNINRELIDFKNALKFHQSTLSSITNSENITSLIASIFDEKFIKKIERLSHEYLKVESSVQTNKDYLYELRNTNDSLLSAKQNETMKKFTILTFVFLPLNFLAAAFGMNVLHMPIVGQENDFWILIVLMFIVGSITAVFFKIKKWL